MSRFTRVFGLIGLALLLTQDLFAQATRTITGQVTSSPDGEPLSYANVIPVGGTVGTVTRRDGRFTLAVPRDETVVLCVSMDDHQEARIEVPRNIQTVSITLKRDERAMPAGSCARPGTTPVERDVKGRVIDSRTRMPLSDVTVIAGGDAGDDSTGGDGRFELGEFIGDFVLRFFRPGYIPQEVLLTHDRYLVDVALVRRDYVDASYREVIAIATDAVSGRGLSDVAIAIEGAKRSEYEAEDETVLTDVAGLATLVVPKGPFTVRASRIGWVEQRVAVEASVISVRAALVAVPSSTATPPPAGPGARPLATPSAPTPVPAAVTPPASTTAPRAAAVTPAPAVIAPRPAPAPAPAPRPAPAAPVPAPAAASASVVPVTDGSVWQFQGAGLTRTSPAPQLTAILDTHNVGINCLDGDPSYRNSATAPHAPAPYFAQPATAEANGRSSSSVCANLGTGALVLNLRWPGTSLSPADQRAFREMLSSLLTMLSGRPAPADSLGLFTPRRAVVPLDASTGDWTFITDYTNANEATLLLQWPKDTVGIKLTMSPAAQTCAQTGIARTTTPLEGIPASYPYAGRAADGTTLACAEIGNRVLVAVVTNKTPGAAAAGRISSLLSRIQSALNASATR